MVHLHAQRGNILFLILLAIILFAALTYAVNQSMRGNGNDTSNESAGTLADHALHYGILMHNTIDRLRLTGSCADTQINFDSVHVTGYTNPNAPTDKHCDVFDSAGGGVIWQAPMNGLNDGTNYIFTGYDNLQGYRNISPYGGCSNGASTCPDLVMILQNVPYKVCKALNARLHVVTTDGEPPNEEDTNVFTKFVGVYSRNEGIEAVNSPLTVAGTVLDYIQMEGIDGLCERYSTSPLRYDYVHFLLLR